jgi:hypothetical protein
MKVSWEALDPSGSASQISHFPERSDVKATLRPSGENWDIPSLLVEEIETTDGDEAGAPGAEVSMRQTLPSVLPQSTVVGPLPSSCENKTYVRFS